jgi:hypothetical protein
MKIDWDDTLLPTLEWDNRGVELAFRQMDAWRIEKTEPIDLLPKVSVQQYPRDFHRLPSLQLYTELSRVSVRTQFYSQNCLHQIPLVD